MLTLFHDLTSPASAVAVLRVQRLADEGRPVAFEGFEAIGVDATLPVTVDVIADVERLATVALAEGLVLRRPPALPPTALAHVVGALADTSGLGASWRAVSYRAYWTDGAAVAEPRVLLDLAVVAGLDREATARALADRSLLAAVRRRAGAHRRNGVGGVPTILASRTLLPGLLDLDELRALAALA